jgi:hypothetical protein
VALSGGESNGVFDIVIKIDPQAKQMHVSIGSREFKGALPADVLDGLRLLDAFRPPHKFRLNLRGGPALAQSSAITADLEGREDFGAIIDLCEALTTIQQHTFVPIHVPDFTKTSRQQAATWIRAAKLLRGDALTFSGTSSQ